jgi:hypothetical protein
MPKIDKALRRDAQREKQHRGMKVSGKSSIRLIQQAIIKKAEKAGGIVRSH